MAGRDGSGTFTVTNPDFVSGTTISSSQVDANFSDVATAITQSIAANGETPITGNLQMNSNKHTGVAAGTALTEYADVKSVQNGTYIWCGTAGGTADAITLTPSPAITAYVTGQEFRWKAGSSANTGAATVAISGLTTKALQINDTALASGEHAANKYYRGVYDGAAFQIEKISKAAGYSDPLTTRGDLVYRNASSTTRLAVGAANTVLKSDGTDAAWGSVAVANLAAGTDGELITWDASGNPAVVAVGTSGQVLTSNGAGAAPTMQTISTGMTLGTYTSLSGTSVDFTGIPSTATVVIISITGASSNGTSYPLFQLGDSGGIETSGYLGAVGPESRLTNFTTGFIAIPYANAANLYNGSITLTLMNAATNMWAASGNISSSNTAAGAFLSGTKALSATLDRVRFTFVNGTDTFDAGSINIAYL